MMNKSVFDKFPSLTTQRLQLRALRVDDLTALLPIVFYKEDEAQDGQRVLQVLEKVQLDFEKQLAITWGIVYEDQLVGTCGYYRGFENDIGEVGYVMNARYRRKGIMKEALKCILQFGFEKMKLKEIRAYTAHDNMPSIALLRQLGFCNNIDSIEGQSGFSIIALND